MKFRLRKSLANSIWIFAIWPVFLFVSQKALVVLEFFHFKVDRSRVNSFVLASIFFGLVLFSGIITLVFSSYNSYSLKHFLSFNVFLIYAILIAGVLSVPSYSNIILDRISLINMFGLILIHFVWFQEIELPGNRGLNFIRGTDNEIHRFFVESSPILLVTNYSRFKFKTVQLFLIGLTLSYFLFISKNTFLSVLLLVKLAYTYFNYFKVRHLFFGLVFMILVSGFGLLNLNGLIRADLILSIIFKLEQFIGIVGRLSLENILIGEGFGFYIKEFATDVDQPYQLEMQLPMLVLQIGGLSCSMLVLGVFFLFKTVRTKFPLISTCLFFAVGIVNPWLFLPVWLITAIYFFK